MAETAILFDLDGTLLPMDNQVFIETYMKLLALKVAPMGFEPRPVIAALWKGAEGMTRNDGSRTNEEAFWDIFAGELGGGVRDLAPEFISFYTHEFDRAKTATGFQPMAESAVKLAKRKADRVILATTPQFPIEAIWTRLKWAGIAPELFDDITCYSNMRFCKPNPDYYRAILDKWDVRPENALMIGNDVEEDIRGAKMAGLQTYLVTDCLIGGADKVLTARGSFKEMAEYLKNLPDRGKG